MSHVPPVVNTLRSFTHSWLITGFVTRVIRRVPWVEQDLLTLPEHLNSSRFLVGSCYSTFSFTCMFCRLLFVLLSFFIWPFCCLSIDLPIMISPLASSNSSILTNEDKNIHIMIVSRGIVLEWKLCTPSCD